MQRSLLIGTLTLTALLAAGAAIVGFSALSPPLPRQRVKVRIVGVGLDETRFRHNVVVAFATTDGLTGQAIIRSDMFSCRIGDTAPAVKRGVSVYLPPPACRQAHGLAQWPGAKR